MANHDESSKSRNAAPPFAGPPRSGPLSVPTRPARPTLPPFSPPFVRRPSPAVAPTPVVPELPAEPVSSIDTSVSEPAVAPNETRAPALEDAGAEPPGVTWIDPDAGPPAAPEQAATGIEWLDTPAPAAATSDAASTADDDDVFGWDPAEEAVTSVNSAPSAESLDALKELEPWALAGVEAPTSQDVASVLERIAARVRSGDLIVPSAESLATDEAALAAVLAALLQRSRG